MKQTLELIHVAPYLPYQLKVECISSFINLDTGVEMLEWQGPYELTVSVLHSLRSHDLTKYIKPLLRLLDRLTQEITAEGYNDGRPFCPVDWLIENTLLPGEIQFWKYIKATGTAGIRTDQISYYGVQKLFEWHFDVFGLIKEGLALPIVTTNK